MWVILMLIILSYPAISLQKTIWLLWEQGCVRQSTSTTASSKAKGNGWRILEEYTGGVYWRSILVEYTGGVYWWRILEEYTGGVYWWRILEEHTSAVYWWIMRVHAPIPPTI